MVQLFCKCGTELEVEYTNGQGGDGWGEDTSKVEAVCTNCKEEWEEEDWGHQCSNDDAKRTLYFGNDTELTINLNGYKSFIQKLLDKENGR